MTLLDLAREVGLDPKKVATTKGGEFASSCPACDGNDRFRIWPNEPAKNCDGKYWCRKCGIHGDSIQFCVDYLRLPFVEAVARVGGTIPAKSSTSFPARPHASSFAEVRAPSEAWMATAEKFVAWSQEELWKRPDVLKMLAQRGLPEDAIRTYRLGYCSKDVFDERERWGLQPKIEDGKEKRFYLPEGIVIPSIDSGRVVRVKIRKTKWKHGDRYGKYYVVSGGMTGFNIVGDISRAVMIVVESELDALALHFSAPDEIVAVSAGSNTTMPDNVTDYVAKKTPNLWICHDNDEAGLAMLAKWEKLYSHCIPHPVPIGKDVGEAIQQGLNLRDWIIKYLKR
jgi:hypothetical protein